MRKLIPELSARRSFFQLPTALFTLPACLQMLDLMRMPAGTRIQDAAKEALFTRYIEALPQVCCPLPFVLRLHCAQVAGIDTRFQTWPQVD